MSATAIRKGTKPSIVLDSLNNTFEQSKLAREKASSSLRNRITAQASNVSVALEHHKKTLSRLQECQEYVQKCFKDVFSGSSSPLSGLQTKLRISIERTAEGQDILNLLMSKAELIRMEIRDDPQILTSFMASAVIPSEKLNDLWDCSCKGGSQIEQPTRAYWNLCKTTLEGYHRGFRLCKIVHNYLMKLPVELGSPTQVYGVNFQAISELAIMGAPNRTSSPATTDNVLPGVKHPILEELNAMSNPKSKQVRAAAVTSPRHLKSLDIAADIRNSLDLFKEDGQTNCKDTRKKLEFLDRLVDECRGTQDTLDEGIEEVADRLTSDLDSAVASAQAVWNSSLASQITQVQDMVSVAQYADMAFARAVHLKVIRRDGVSRPEENFLARELDGMQFELNSLRLEEEVEASPQPNGFQGRLLENKRKVLKLLSGLSSSIDLEVQNRKATAPHPVTNPEPLISGTHSCDELELNSTEFSPNVSFDPDFECGQSRLEPGSYQTFADELNSTSSPIVIISQLENDAPYEDSHEASEHSGVEKQEDNLNSWANLPFFEVDISFDCVATVYERTIILIEPVLRYVGGRIIQLVGLVWACILQLGLNHLWNTLLVLWGDVFKRSVTAAHHWDMELVQTIRWNAAQSLCAARAYAEAHWWIVACLGLITAVVTVFMCDGLLYASEEEYWAMSGRKLKEFLRHVDRP
ncbi:hypothetical protein AAF712_007582 [Marasmius tenuissimus]|uniref:Uncharacterized protein n=1 Tax=Marasmius tenuissimus TaxID=585030 RepID=A0ABR2ZWF6_9AGAR